MEMKLNSCLFVKEHRGLHNTYSNTGTEHGDGDGSTEFMSVLLPRKQYVAGGKLVTCIQIQTRACNLISHV